MKIRSVVVLAVISVLVFSGFAGADAVFTTSDFTSGTLGVVGESDGELKAWKVDVGFGGDTVAFSYDGGRKLLLSDKDAQGQADDSLYIYDDAADLSHKRNVSLRGVRNIKDVEYLGGNLYFICEDGKVVKVAPATLTAVGEPYEPDAADIPAGYFANGVSLASLGGDLYALYYLRDANYTGYAASMLVRLTADLAQAGIVNGLGKNAHTVLASGGDLYVASFGGSQTSETSLADSKVEKIAAGDTKPGVVFTADELGDGGLIASLGLDDAGLPSLVATHKYLADWSIEAANVYKISSALDPASKRVIKPSLKGFYTLIAYDDATKLVWVASTTGGDGLDQLTAFDISTLDEKKSFSAADLGGPIYSMAAVKKTTSSGDSSSSGGGGCASDSFALPLALLVPLLLPRRKRK